MRQRKEIYPASPIGQFGHLFLLHLINRHGAGWRDFSWYSGAYFKAFPPLAQDYPESELDYIYGQCGKAFFLRFCQRFTKWFGLVETQKFRLEDSWRERADIRRTDFLNKVLVSDGA